MSAWAGAAAFDLRCDRSLVLLIDVQERFVPAIPGIAPEHAVGRRMHQLMAGAALLGVPRLISEQIPSKLGPTLPYLRNAAGDCPVLSKRHFSVADDQDLAAAIATHAQSTVILAGIEAHICVLATALDLRAAQRSVVICADAVASRDAAHVAIALDTARAAGCLILPVESVLMRWQRIAGEGRFKELSALIR